MNIHELESDIVARLAPLVNAGIEVIASPDTEAAYKRPTKPRVIVAFSGAMPAGAKDGLRAMGAIVQNFEVLINVIVQTRNIRGTDGLYSVERVVRSLLIGYMPVNCAKMTLQKMQVENYEDGTWNYVITFAAPTVFVEDEPEITEVLLNQITVISNGGQTSVIQ